MNAITMNGEFGTEKPIDRTPMEVPLRESTTSTPVVAVAAEPVKEKKMENVAQIGRAHV